MGIKGEKLTQDAALAAELMIEKLVSTGDITSKRMFGGYG